MDEWGTPWPNCVYSNMRGLANEAFVGGVHKELVDLLDYLIKECERKGYRFLKGQCWGFACRSIRGSNPPRPSNHSQGKAIDVNSAYNWLGRTDGGNIPNWMWKLFWEYKFRWGGLYVGRKDPMHFEFMGTVAEARRLTKKAMEAFAEEDDEMSYQEFKQGWKAFRQGEAEPAEPGDLRFGYMAAKYAGENPAGGDAPSVPTAHEHPHVHDVKKTGREEAV